jgi:hypothetical protein
MGYMTLMMTPDGRVFASFDDTLVQVGASGDDALEAICMNRAMPDVPGEEAHYRERWPEAGAG